MNHTSQMKNTDSTTITHNTDFISDTTNTADTTVSPSIELLEKKVMSGQPITYEEALSLKTIPLDKLTSAADIIRIHFCKNVCDICSVAAVKTGQCTENCLYCAQSTRAKIPVEQECVLGESILTDIAVSDKRRGSYRYGLVSVGRRLNKNEVALAANNIRDIKKNADIHICASFGMLDSDDFRKLKTAGLSMVHNNLESSESFFKTLCTTHSQEDKIRSIKAAKQNGLKLCSGGLIGLGESLDDRIELAFLLKELDVDSVPVNMLNPIPGTFFENAKPLTNDEYLRTIAIFRFILPDTFIRLAAGRSFLPDNGKQLCVQVPTL